METKPKYLSAALFFCLVLSAMAPVYPTGAALPERAKARVHAMAEPPGFLRTVAASHSSTRLVWSGIPGGASGYEVERKLPGGAFSKVGETAASEFFFYDENLLSDTVYIYRVRAVTGGVPSPYSNHSSIHIGNPISFIPAGARLDPDENNLRAPLENNVGFWGAIHQDDEFPVFGPGDCLDGDFYLGIQLSHDLGDFNTASPWDLSLEITMKYDGDSLWTKPLELNNGEQTLLATIFHDQAISCDPGYSFSIREKTFNGTVPANNVSLKVLLFEKEEGGFSAADPMVLSHHYNDIKSLVTWSHSRKGTASYDLEWVFISEHENFTGTTADSAFRFKEPVRINTADPSYSHHIFYPKGKVWYRVRAIGFNPDFPGHRILGNWTFGVDGGMAVENTNAGVNWQLQTSFAEQGKYKNLLQYLDGSLRQRQAVTNLNTGDQVMVGETKYDFEGREAVALLPAPVEGQSLAFRPGINAFTSSDPAITAHTSSKREKYHYDNGSLANSGLSTASGTGKYYSPANDRSMVHKDYLPDAEGFAYSQKTYTPDGTGRVAVQSGVGEKFRTDGGRPTRFYYGEAATEELVRLFGPNVGKASHYRKNMTVDPNGQASVTYVDQEGRTVATALAGESPAGILDPLESYTADELASRSPEAAYSQPPGPSNEESLLGNDQAGEEEEYSLQKDKDWEQQVETEREQRAAETLESHRTEIAGERTDIGQPALMNLSLPSQEEYDALMALYQSTGGPNWTNNTGWRDADPNTLQSVHGWAGLTVLSWGAVNQIDLSNNNLNGTIPANINAFESLRVLGLSNNLLRDSLPSSIWELTSLTHLDLQYNQLEGNLPNSVNLMSDLKMLNLRNNLFSGKIPHTIGTLADLGILYLSSNQFHDTIPRSIGQLSKLKSLYLFNNQLSGVLPKEIGNLGALVDMRLENNFFDGGIPREFGNMKNLKYFYLHTSQLSGEIPAELSKLQNLETLSLSNNNLNGPIPAGLGKIKSLQRISLVNNSLSGPIPPELGQLENLVSLTLDRNDFIGTIPASLGNLKKLKTLHLYNNELSGNIPLALGGIDALTSLVLFGNQLTGTIPTTMGGLSNLTELRLENNLLTGTIPSSLGQLTNLTNLWLYSNHLAGPIPTALTELTLTSFSIRYNYFTVSDLLPVEDLWTSEASYLPQRKISSSQAYNLQSGENLSLSAGVDLDTDPPSEFQWFKGSQSVSPRSASGHTLVLEDVSTSHSGNYSFRVWNSSLPNLTLTSETQNVQVESPGWKSLTVDLMSHNRVEDNSSTVSKILLNTVPNTSYSLSYELSGLGTQLEGIGCSSCSFELEIILLDPEGKPVNLGGIPDNTATDSLSYRNSYTVDDCMVEQTEATVNTGGIVLKDIGEYTLVKELRLLSPTATQAMAEIRNSPVFVGQLAALDTLYNSYGDCEFCTPEDVCPEAEEAIAQAVAETAAMECENIREKIIADILREKDSYTEQDIMAHDLYCQYQNCIRDMDATLFETNTVRIGGWNAADSLRDHMADKDPFYNDSGTGVDHKPALLTALDNITIGGYTGTLHQVTNPTNTAMYYNAAGLPDPINGKHLLYTNLLDQRAAMGEIWYEEKLDAQRWMLFKNFYFEASRKIKLGIAAYANCDASKDVLMEMDKLPTTEEGMAAWALTNDIVAPVDSLQVDAIRHMLVEDCGGDFTQTERNNLYAHLEAYFNGNRMTNPLNLLLEEDLVANPHLAAVETIMDGKGCSLVDKEFAVSNPTVCLRDTLVFADSPAQRVMTGGVEEEKKIYIHEKAPYNLSFQHLAATEDREAEKETLKASRPKNGEQEQAMALLSTGLTQAEYDALISLYQATNGSSWNSSWPSYPDPYPTSVENWQGITTNSNGNVIAIELASNGLNGYIPDEIGDLEYLQFLDLGNNSLSGAIPGSMGNLTHLQQLDLSYNSLNYVPPQMGSLANLEYLFLENNPLGSIPSQLKNLGSLFHLNLENTGLSGVFPLDSINFTVRLANNGFTFGDLLHVKSHFSTSGYYSPQDSVDSSREIHVPTSQTLVLTTAIDGNTTPASEYQWFKDGVAVNTRSASGHTYTISNASSSHSGDYYYKIWNADLPGLELISRVQEVLVYSGQPIRICLEYATGNSQGGYGQPGSNPTMELFSLPITWAEITTACLADGQARAVALKGLAEEKLMESWLREYYAEFDLSCLDHINETFTYTYTPKEYHYTLYYYDQSGSLVQTVPPKGVQPMANAQVELVKSGSQLHPAHTLATRYRYNSRGQLTAQESPDAGESQFWYNKAGQLRLSQDARQATEGAYSYTQYDRQSRVTETGELLSTEHIDSLKAKLDNPVFPSPVQYSRHDVTLTRYDRAREGSDPTFVQENLRSRVSWTAMVERDAIDTVFTLYSYDAHGNVKALLQDLPGLGSKRTEYRYDLVSGNVNLVLYQYGRPDAFIHRYSYYADNRIEEVHTSTDGYVWNQEAKYFYYPHGPLARVELGEYNVQGMDYYYTLQGWLKGVNMPSEGDPGEDGIGGFRTGTDAFAFALGYYEGDYKPINPNAVVSDSRDKLWDRYRDTRDTVSAAGLYNGNISWMSTDLPGLGSNRIQAMVYGYDQLHRIVQARSLSEYGTNGYDARAPGANKYDVDYTYDPNGNLLTLKRLDENTSLRDDLTYEYNIGTNRLRNTDPADGENYTYDQIGNLISDNAEGIDSIAWTPYGKVRAVHKADNTSVSFRYDASGNRIAKIASGDTTVYVRDASGNVMGIYKNDTLIEQSIYGSSRLGLMTTSSKTGYRTLGGKKYELSNHLGNVLAVVTDNINFDQDSTWASVVNMTDYYPFGLAMEERTVQDSTYRYGFNGKEDDQEIGTQNYGFRIYNPSIGKFLSVDPMGREFPWNTPYAFAENDVIRSIDLEGLEKLIVTNRSKATINDFFKVVRNDEILKKQIYDPISNPELVDKVHIYFITTEHFGHNRGPQMNGVTFRSYDVEKMISDIDNYKNGDESIRKKYSRTQILKNDEFLKSTELDINLIKSGINSGIKIFIVGVNSNRSVEQKENTLLHEIGLHLKNFDNADANKDHIEGFGKETYPNGKNPYYSPEITPPNSKMGKMQERFKNSKKNEN